MKAIAIVKFVFSFIGIGMLVGTFFMYKSTNSFLAEASKAEGTVIELVPSRSNDSITYRPIVRFTSQSGQEIEFASSTSSNPPSYATGQTVEVLYLSTNPQDAKINGFFSLWGGSVILGGLGGVFFLLGSGIILAGMLTSHKEEYLKMNGTPIETEYQRVELNTALSVNGRHPFRILTQWQNPATAELHVFESDNIWFDPSSYIKSKKITVFIEQGNPKKYHVDLSFLPKLAQ